MNQLTWFIYCLVFLLMPAESSAYRIITPVPFSLANKNYIKIQVLADKDDLPVDSVFCDILYNSGSTITQKMDASLSTVLTLNSFNDGVFYVRARVYHAGVCDTLGSVYAREGIPVLLDRHHALNETSFSAAYLTDHRKIEKAFLNAKQYEFAGNNNTLHFCSLWDTDSLYFRFTVSDAQLNDAPPGQWDLYQARNYLKVLWTSDCIELGLDLLHNHSEWKATDDYEFLADIRGNSIGNQWSVKDSIYNNWGKTTRIDIKLSGTANQNQDTDSGYVITLAIPWKEMNFSPKPGQSIGFDIQLYDKDGDFDEPFRSSLSGTNPESNDNTSEWTNLVLEKKRSSSLPVFLALIPVFIAFAFMISRKNTAAKKTIQEEPGSSGKIPAYSEVVNKAISCISEQYEDPDLSRKKIADQVFISEKYLSTIFKKETGENLLSYINKYRINKSLGFLKETKIPISEIAFKVGYNSLQNFNKNFKAITQQSPSDYRKTEQSDF